MKKELILELFQKFESICYLYNDIECWSAREWQSLLGYSKWENFEKVINKAKDSCNNAGENINDHFPDVRKMITKGKGAKDEIDDILLTRLFEPNDLATHAITEQEAAVDDLKEILSLLENDE